ncbi:MAG: ABC transporter permease [Acidobacteria bacterium]|nr:ABC transporter permease [Acidobacteriota bacterium]
MHLLRAAGVSARILVAHRLRTAVSSSAICLGVASLVLSVGSSQAAKRDLLNRIRGMGLNTLVISAGSYQRIGRHLLQTQPAHTLKPRDVDALRRNLPGLLRASGIARGSASLSWRGASDKAAVLGVEAQFIQIRRIVIAQGRMFTRSEDRGLSRLVVLGAQQAEDLFAYRNPVGETIRINGAPYRVAGVAARKGLQGDDSIDSFALVPLRTAMVRLFHRGWLDQIVLEAARPAAVQELQPMAAELLRRNHRLLAGREDDFAITDPARTLTLQYQTGAAFQGLSRTVAVVSLTLGSIGILAVMLMAARERVHEVGLRRATGARRRDILTQFLGESVLLGAIGGLAGVLIGLCGMVVLCHLLRWSPLLPWQATALGFVSSLAIGVLSGVYPAVRAARMPPVTALRASR